jgi:hypothetical protein
MKHALFFLSVSVFCVIVLRFAFPPLVAAQTPQAWSGLCVGGPQNDVATIQGLECLLANVLSVAVSGLGVIGFIMIIIGAFRYQLSAGQTKGTEGGRQTITFAVFGIVLALSAVMILNLIADFTGVQSILNFRVPSSQDAFQ